MNPCPVGLGEFLLLLLLALLLVGPSDLPPIARRVGRLVRHARKAVEDLKETLVREDDGSDGDPPP
ncbi:MAG: twin-arginine translocase TatA/TatE family subunit [Deltaproteobacteria bacterium]|nr:twin-arginine translocase TatA/TatE family subunit [Deltaproteobacteria bacterium]